MGEVEPLAIVACGTCSWWWFFWDQRPTIPFTCDLCKAGEPPWETRKNTPSYGTPRARQQTVPFGLEEETTTTRFVVVERKSEPPPAPKKRKKKR